MRPLLLVTTITGQNTLYIVLRNSIVGLDISHFDYNSVTTVLRIFARVPDMAHLEEVRTTKVPSL